MCVWPPPPPPPPLSLVLCLSLWAGSRPKRVLTRLMGFHTLKYTHVHTRTHNNVEDKHVWKLCVILDKYTHTHTHTCTLWYKRICQAPTLYTCKTNGLQYPHKHYCYSLISKIFHTPASGNTGMETALSSAQIWNYTTSQLQCCISVTAVHVTCHCTGGSKRVHYCKSVFRA